MSLSREKSKEVCFMKTPIAKMNTTKLADFLTETEKIATEALQLIDSNSYFQITPSHDLGMPYDVDRLSGGFPNGVYVHWICKEPIIPIDATVNVCTASIFELENANSDKIFLDNLKKLESVWGNGCYILNFNSGNHFIILCEDAMHKRYLVMHSTAKEFTKGYNGLYPTKNNWYYDKIHVYERDNRYFRYIIGHEAELFYKTAASLDGYNEVRHEHIAESLLKGYAKIKSVDHHHHYGMPDSHSINIGCYLKKDADIFPVFSKPNYPITLFKIKSSSQVAANGEYIVPHGWGKESKSSYDININYGKRTLIFNGEIFSLFNGDTFYRSTQLQYRDYVDSNGVNRFYECFRHHLKGEVRNTLFQLIAYTASGITVLESCHNVA